MPKREVSQTGIPKLCTRRKIFGDEAQVCPHHTQKRCPDDDINIFSGHGMLTVGMGIKSWERAGMERCIIEKSMPERPEF